MSKKRIIKGKIEFISLVPRGANRIQTILKDDKESFSFDILTKGFDKNNGELLAVVYAPELRDTHGHIASQQVIKDIIDESSKDGIKLDVRHNLQPLQSTQARITQSWIVAAGDQRFTEMKTYDGNTFDATGAWAVVIKIDDPALRSKYESGEWKGVSMYGYATLVEEPIKNEPGDNMTPQELQAALAANNVTLMKTVSEAIATGVKEGIEKELDSRGIKKVEKSEKSAGPKLSANASAADIRAFGMKQRRALLVKSIEDGSADDVDAVATEIEQIDEAIAEITKSAKTAGASNQPLRKSDDRKTNGSAASHPAATVIGLSKSDNNDNTDPNDLAALGYAMAAAVNGTGGKK